MTHAESNDSGSWPALLRGIDGIGHIVLGTAGLVLEAGRRATGRAGLAEVGSVLARVVRFGGDATGAGPWAADWARRGRDQQRRNERAAQEALRTVLRAALTFAVDEVEVDEIVARVDIDAVMARVDLADLVQRVLDEIDVNQVIQESSSTMAAETVDAVRTRSMRADRVVNRLVDHVLQRREERRTGLEDVSLVPLGASSAEHRDGS